jgi:hypothetical protein
MKKEVIFDWCAFYCCVGVVTFEASLVKVKDFLWLAVLVDIFKRSRY